ncbi:MAG: UvrB/UvrC motif-containing protein [Planctomycetota bacterium]|jgi:hypothetical protein
MSDEDLSDQDLSDFLTAWGHEPGRINARQIKGRDGRPKLQVRIDLGVLQMEMDGRPDGRKPNGHDSCLAGARASLERYTAKSGALSGFALGDEACRALREEAVQLYHRYVGLFALGDYARVVRDTNVSLAIFDLCRDYAASERDRTVLEQFRPQVIMMRTRAEAELAVSSGTPREAVPALDRGLEELRAVYTETGRSDEWDCSNEVQLLRGMRDALIPKLPASERAELQERLQAAIDAENYELAAILRDELRMMRQ